MNYPVLEKLACPYHLDAMLSVNVLDENKLPLGNGLSCDKYCYRLKKHKIDVSEDLCNECQMLDIIDADLTCCNCGRIYHIEHGIAMIMPDELSCAGEKMDASFCDSKLREIELRNSLAQWQIDGAYSSLQTEIEVDALISAINSDQKELLLDIGCGSGRLTRLYHNRFSNVIGIDFAINTLRTHRAWAENNSIRNIDLIQADASYLPIKRGVLDNVFCNDVLQHVPVHLMQGVIGNIFISMKSEGRFFITVRAFSCVRKLIQLLRHMRVSRDGSLSAGVPIHFFEVRELSGLLSNAGFRVMNLIGLYNGVPRYPGILFQYFKFLEKIIQRTPLSLITGNLYAATATKS